MTAVLPLPDLRAGISWDVLLELAADVRVRERVCLCGDLWEGTERPCRRGPTRRSRVQIGLLARWMCGRASENERAGLLLEAGLFKEIAGGENA